MRNALLIAATTGYQIRSFGDAADTLGVGLVFASDRCDRLADPWRDRAIPIRFHDLDGSVAALVGALAHEPPAAVLAVGDRPALLAARAAQAFGLPCHPPAAAERSRNKLQSRRALEAAGLPTPSFRAIVLGRDPTAQPRTLPYPVVIKPLGLSGSRGVMRADDDLAFDAAVRRLRRLLLAPDVQSERDAIHDHAIVESFIPGRELALEGLMTAGTLAPLAIFDKPDPLDGPFFEETIYVTPSREPGTVQRAVIEHVARAARAIGLHHGPVHAECRLNARGVYVLEVAARPIGGLCSKALKLTASDGTPASLEEVLLRHALGDDVSSYSQPPGASGVMMIPIPMRGVFKGVEGVDDARHVQGVEDVIISAKLDSRLIPLPEGHSYLGFIFASGDTPAAVDAALRAAHARLRFDVQKELALASL